MGDNNKHNKHNKTNKIMNTSDYKFMFKTEFKCFAEHYNEFIDYIIGIIAEEEEEDDINAIVIDTVQMNMRDEIVKVVFHYTYDEDERILDVDFDEFNN